MGIFDLKCPARGCMGVFCLECPARGCMGKHERNIPMRRCTWKLRGCIRTSFPIHPTIIRYSFLFLYFQAKKGVIFHFSVCTLVSPKPAGAGEFSLSHTRFIPKSIDFSYIFLKSMGVEKKSFLRTHTLTQTPFYHTHT